MSRLSRVRRELTAGGGNDRMCGVESDQGEETICMKFVHHSWDAMIRTQPHFLDILATDA